MSKTDSIARRILGWKLNTWDRWYDFENDIFIHSSDFQPDKNMDHAMRIVNRLEQFGYTYQTNGVSEVSFNDVWASGDTLPEAITNAAYAIIEKNSVVSTSSIWQQLC